MRVCPPKLGCSWPTLARNCDDRIFRSTSFLSRSRIWATAMAITANAFTEIPTPTMATGTWPWSTHLRKSRGRRKPPGGIRLRRNVGPSGCCVHGQYRATWVCSPRACCEASTSVRPWKSLICLCSVPRVQLCDYLCAKNGRRESAPSDLRTRLPLTPQSLTEARLLTCGFFFHAAAFAGLPHARYSSISRARAKSI